MERQPKSADKEILLHQTELRHVSVRRYGRPDVVSFGIYPIRSRQIERFEVVSHHHQIRKGEVLTRQQARVGCSGAADAFIPRRRRHGGVNGGRFEFDSERQQTPAKHNKRQKDSATSA
jgi:hypothetical protein